MIILIGIITAALSLFDFAHFRVGRGARTLQIHPNLPSSDTFSREASYGMLLFLARGNIRPPPSPRVVVDVVAIRGTFLRAYHQVEPVVDNLSPNGSEGLLLHQVVDFHRL